MGRPIYVDLDATLIDSDVDERGNVIRIHARPGADQFLGNLSKHGDLFLLTHAMRPHVKNAFRVQVFNQRRKPAIQARQQVGAKLGKVLIVSIPAIHSDRDESHSGIDKPPGSQRAQSERR